MLKAEETHMNTKHLKWTDHEHYIRLVPPQEFSYDQTLGYMARSSNECMYHIDHHSIIKLLPIGDEHVLVQITGDPDGSIHVEFLGLGTVPEMSVRASAAAYVWDWFDLDVDLVPFYEMAQQDLLLGQIVHEFYGLRNVGIPDLFEALCWGIMGQQINLTFAYTLKRRFVESFGESVTWEERKYWIFPTPEAIAQLTVSDLTSLQFTGKKSEYLIGTAKLLTDRTLSKTKLLDIGDSKLIEKELVQIRGIGPWTANYVLMRCIRAPSAFPIDDVGLHNAIKHLLELEKKPSIPEIQQLAAHWGDWKSYATFYLWRVLY
jgi:DNA-3-methyladenine glycosylase II